MDRVNKFAGRETLIIFFKGGNTFRVENAFRGRRNLEKENNVERDNQVYTWIKDFIQILINRLMRSDLNRLLLPFVYHSVSSTSPVVHCNSFWHTSN